jgi:hypothetical protein
MLLLIDNGRINLNPRQKGSGSKSDRYLQRSDSTIEGLTGAPFNLVEEEQRRRYADMNYATPALDKLVTRASLDSKQSPDDLGGLWEVRRDMHEWVRETLNLKMEEALYCELTCLTCLPAQCLACATTNVSSASRDGVDLNWLIQPKEE